PPGGSAGASRRLGRPLSDRARREARGRRVARAPRVLQPRRPGRQRDPARPGARGRRGRGRDAMLPRMRGLAGKRVVVTGGTSGIGAATNGLVGHPLYADYNASKAAVIALARTMALELAPRVRVNCVCPGYVLTPMQEAEYTPEMLRATDAKIPLGRHARPEEVAALFAFLASDDGAYLTGAVIPVDGGETAGGLASRSSIS